MHAQTRRFDVAQGCQGSRSSPQVTVLNLCFNAVHMNGIGSRVVISGTRGFGPAFAHGDHVVTWCTPALFFVAVRSGPPPTSGGSEGVTESRPTNARQKKAACEELMFSASE